MLKRDVLQQFYNDKATLTEVKDYLTQFLREEAVRMVFDRDDVTGVVQANDMIEKAWNHLDDIFESKEVKSVINDSK